MNNRTSSFAGLGGILFLFILILYTNALGYLRLMGFLVFFLCIALCSFLWGRYSLKKLSLSLTREDLSAFPGETVPVRLTVSNPKLLPVIWLNILFPLPDTLFIRPDDGEEAESFEDPESGNTIQVFPRKLTWLLPFQEIEWSFQLKACGRGVHLIDSVCLESGDGFGLTAVGKKLPLACPRQLIVYPERIQADVTPLLSQDTSEARGSYGYQEDLTLLKHSRAYQYGDSARRINWRLFARSQELMVNEYETISPQCIGFYIDLESFVSLRIEQTANGGELKLPTLRSDELERMLSLVGSCICELTERRIHCSLLIPAYEGREAQILFGTELDYQIPQLLTELSMISYDGMHWETRLSPAELMSHRSRLGQLCIVGYSAAALHAEAVMEAMPPHLLSYLIYERSSAELFLERPVRAYSELTPSATAKEEPAP